MTRLYRSLVPLLLFGILLVGCDSGGSSIPSDVGDSTSVALSETGATLEEGDATYTVDLTITDPGFKEVPVGIAFNASQSTTTRGEDVLVPTDTTIRFPESATSGGTISFDIPIADDQMIEEDETAVFDFTVPDSVQAMLGGNSQFTLTINDNDQFGLWADAQGLEPASGNTDAHCIVQRSSGEVVFFNSSEGGVFSYGTDLNTERSASNLNSDISAESNPIDRCDGVAKDGSDNVYFLFRSSDNSAGTTYIYKLAASGSPTVLGSEEGIGAVAHDNGTVYLAGVQFDGAPADGFYSVNDTDQGQTLSVVATESALDLGNGMDVDADGNLYAFSGGFGGTESRTRKIVRVTDPSGSATIEEFVDPYRNGSPLVPDSGSDITDVDFVNRDGDEFLVVYNGSFQAENGDQWGSIRISDQSISLLFNRTQLIENSPAGDFVSGFTEPIAVNDDGEVFVASRAASFGGEYYIARVVDQLP